MTQRAPVDQAAQPLAQRAQRMAVAACLCALLLTATACSTVKTETDRVAGAARARVDAIISTPTLVRNPTTRPTGTRPSAGQAASRPAVVNTAANFRSGPGTNFPIVGGAKQGDRLEIRACRTDVGWCQLAGGQWIFAELIDLAPAPAAAAATPAPSAAASATPAGPAPAATPIPSATATATPAPTVTATATPAPTATATASATPLPTATATALPTLTATQTPKPTATATATPTPTATRTPTPLPTATATATVTATPAPTATPLPTATVTPAPTATPLPTATAASVPPPAATASPAPAAPPPPRRPPVLPGVTTGPNAFAVPRFFLTWRLLAAKAALEAAARPASPPIASAAPTAPAAAALPDYGRRLPGLSYVKLVAYWQEKVPLECKGPISANQQLVWNCNLIATDGSAQMTMIIFATAGDSLNRITISVLPNGAAGKDTADRWLNYAAGTPIAGAAVEQVKTWLARAGENDDTLTVGRVRYIVGTSGPARTFEIIPAPGS